MQEIADQIEPGTVIEIREEGKPSSDTRDDKRPRYSGAARRSCFLSSGELLSFDAAGIDPAVLIAYLILGREVLLTALKNMKVRPCHGWTKTADERCNDRAFAIGEFGEAVGVMLFYRVGEAFEHRAIEKSRSQIMEAVDLRPETVLLDERHCPGDRPVLPPLEYRADPPGDRIPLDGSLSRRAASTSRSPGAGSGIRNSRKHPDLRLRQYLRSLKDARGKRALRVHGHRILDSVENAAASKPQAERFITKFARYTPFVVALAAATRDHSVPDHRKLVHWIYALTFLVISCPCALVLSVPLAFFSGIGAGSRKDPL